MKHELTDNDISDMLENFDETVKDYIEDEELILLRQKNQIKQNKIKEMKEEFAIIKEQIKLAPKTPRPDKVRTIKQLLLNDFQITISPNIEELQEINVNLIENDKEPKKLKCPMEKEWQKSRNTKDEIPDIMEALNKINYDKFFGVLTGAKDANNIMVIDFDVKRLPEDVKSTILQYIDKYLNSEFIQNMVIMKQLYIETTMSGGLHAIVSVNDETERKSQKLLQFGTFEAITEIVGKNHHCVIYPTDSYSRVKNQLYEIQKISSFEYDALIDFTCKFFCDKDSNIHTDVKGKDKVTNPDKQNKSSKSNVDTSTLDKDETQIKNYQSKFAESKKDLEILQKLLQENGYTEISSDANYILYTHSNSTKSDPNFSVDLNNHCVRSFSSNNMQFEVDVNYGTLRACYILYLSINPDKGLRDFFEYLKTKYDITLIRDANEIMKLISNKDLVITKDEIFINDYYCSGMGYYQVSLIQDDMNLIQKSVNQIINLVDLTDKKEIFELKKCLDKRQIFIPKMVQNYVYCIDEPETKYNFNLQKNEVDIFVQTTLREKTQNNELWEWYLKDRFPNDKDYIKQWIGAYCYYSKYEFENDIEPQRLSSLILLGERGVGKGTFANLIKDIFGKNHYALLNPDKATSKFDTWKGKKLSFIDESTEKKKNYTPKIYGTMKEVNGDPYVNVEGKMENQKLIKNQCTFIVASNDATPFFTVFDEIPTNPDTNQFFVCEFEYSAKYNSKVVKELRDSFLHYIKTELKRVFLEEVVPLIQSDRNIRWVIPTPITERQQLMFASSKTTNDFVVEHIVRNVYEDDLKWLTANDLKAYAEEHETKKDYIINLLVERKIINRVSQSRKKKDHNGILKSETSYTIIPETVSKLVQKLGITTKIIP